MSVLCSFGVQACATFPTNCIHKVSSIRFAAILFSWIFSLPQASLNYNIADGEGVVKSRTYQDAL